MKTLDRYVIREILPPLFLSLLIFTFILEIPVVMQQLESLVAKGVSWGIAARIMVTLVPQALGLTIPMALLVGLLIGLGRLSADREAVALLACGVSPYRLLRPVLMLVAVFGGIHLWVMIDAIPDANQSYRQITYEVVSKRVENDVRPGVFFDTFPGWVLYARDIPKDRSGWKDVMVADTRTADATDLYMARHGLLRLDQGKRTVELLLEDGTRYSSSGAGKENTTFRFQDQLIVKLDPESVFPRIELVRGTNELTIPDLRKEAAAKIKAGLSPHPEILAIQQKFSFPFACLVFGIIGVALGLSTARDSKVAGFVVGTAVIFVYYALMIVSESLTKGGHLEPHVSRWVPNIILLPFGIVALIWRARWAEGRLPFRSVVQLSTSAAMWWQARRTPAEPGRGATASRRSRTVLVVRVPQLSWVKPTILDRYISRMYFRTAGLSFVALLGIFYISTFIDRSDKLFKGQASGGLLVQLLALLTPQFVYYVIPLAALLSVLVTFGLLSRTSELTVMKACGISLYRASLPILVLSIAWSTALYGLEQSIMARANRRADAIDSEIRGRPPRTSNPLNRRWLVGRDGAIYHYTYFDPWRSAIDNLAIYRPVRNGWALDSELFVKRAVFAGGQWTARTGWQQEFVPKVRWAGFAEQPLALEPPDYFETEQPIPDMMTVPQLKRFIDEQRASGFNVVPETIELQKKLAFPFVTIVMTLLAIPFGVTTGKRGTLYGVGIGIVLALTYWILAAAFAAVGKAGLLAPVMAGWAPNILAAGTAGYLYLTART